MNSENLYILQKKPCASITEFISHWKKLYSYFDDSMYKLNINKLEFEPQDLVELFHWKNGMTLKGSGGKEKSFNEKILKRIDIINQYIVSENYDNQNIPQHKLIKNDKG